MRDNFELLGREGKEYRVRCKLCGEERVITQPTYAHRDFLCRCQRKRTVICKNCGVEFETISRTAKFYSKRCAGAYKRTNCKPIPKPIIKRKYNKYPVTKTTRMLICVYTGEGMTPEAIGKILRRPLDEVEKILKKCQKSGEYDRHITRSPWLKR